jgi:tetratricopeptide (TPR) repeat protein
MSRSGAIKTVIAVAAVAAAAAAVYFAMTRGNRVEKLAAQGRALVEDENCPECPGATEEGLRSGLADLETAVEAGVEDEDASLRALSDGYNNLLLRYLQPGSADYTAYQERLKAINERILARDPTNVEALLEQAAALEDKEEQLAAFERITEIDPTFAPARYALGVMFYERGQKDEAIEQMKLAVRNATEPDDFSYYVRLRDFLTSEGRLEEAEEFASRFGDRYNPS